MARTVVYHDELRSPDAVGALLAGPEPVTTLDLRGSGCTDEVLVDLLDRPETATLTALVLDDCRLTATGLAALAARDRPLRELRLDRSGVWIVGLAAILAAPWASGLAVLTLDAGEHDFRGVPYPGPAIAAAGLSGLRELDLSHWPITDVDVAALAAALPAGVLTDLRLDHTGLENREVAVLAGAPAFAGLRTLSLAGNQLRYEAARSLARSTTLTSLRRLDLRDNQLTEPGAELLLEVPTLTDLRFSGGAIAGWRLGPWERALQRFPDMPLPPGIRSYVDDDPSVATEYLTQQAGRTSIGLSAVRLGPRGLAVLLAALDQVTCTQLRLERNSLGDAGAQALARTPALAGLTALTLPDNDIGPAGGNAIAASPYLRQLEALDLSGNALGPAGIAALAAGPFPHLRQLILTGTHPGDIRPLLHWPGLDRLDRLDLSGNDFSDTERTYHDWTGPVVYSIPADADLIALQARLGDRLRTD